MSESLGWNRQLSRQILETAEVRAAQEEAAEFKQRAQAQQPLAQGSSSAKPKDAKGKGKDVKGKGKEKPSGKAKDVHIPAGQEFSKATSKAGPVIPKASSRSDPCSWKKGIPWPEDKSKKVTEKPAARSASSTEKLTAAKSAPSCLKRRRSQSPDNNTV